MHLEKEKLQVGPALASSFEFSRPRQPSLECLNCSPPRQWLFLEQTTGGHVASTSTFISSFLPRVKPDHRVTKEERGLSASLETR